MGDAVNLEELEALARAALPQDAYDYYAGAADDEIALRDNREAFRRTRFACRVLVDVGAVDTSTEVLGVRLPFPVILAPTAMHKLAHPEGESATARAAAEAGSLMTLSSISTTSIEDVAAAADGADRWFQLYCYGDRSTTEMLVKRAVAAGYKGIALTVDVPVIGRRERDWRNHFALPPGMTLANFSGAAAADRQKERQDWSVIMQTPTLTWDDAAWLRGITDLPLLIKGLVRADDAARAVDAGFDAVWVSNHGGRQLDRSIATADALPAVVDAVGGRVPVIVDGGVRRGTDVLAALAMGASAVAVGRPQLWALAAGGQDGVRSMLEMLRQEVERAMALAGCPSVADVDGSILA